MNEVTIVITSCGRPDLLKTTIQSFLNFNTYDITQWIIIEDSGIPTINKELEETYPNFMWIRNEQRIGQIKSIDKAYSFVKTPYIFHLEDDWVTYRSGCIEESLKILGSNETISAVMCREHGEGGYKISDNPPFLSCWGEWGYYSFNPGLRRLSDYKTLFNSSYSSFVECNITEGLKGEIAINKFYKEKGFRMAMTSDPSGYLRHIGNNRHVGNTIHPPLTNPKIGLCMIVKDEAHIIKEVLECTLPLIDTYCIVDTGSSDNTIETIQNFYKEKNIEGYVFEREWKDFGTNRSQALALCDGKMDYIFVMDADDLIKFPENGKRILTESLKYNPNAVQLTMVQGPLNYTRLLIYKANDGWKYKGVLHEYPANDKPNNKILKLSNFMVESRRLGARTMKDPTNKMKRDIATLLKGLEDEPDNERYMFYLAQSYRDDGQIDKAVEWYKKRFEIGRWYEESYISAYNIAKLTNSKEWAWKAHEHNPKRIECLYSYISWCRNNSIFSQELFAMANYAASVPKPVDQHLFVETDIYDWKIFDELSIIAFYTGHKDIALQMSDKLLAEEKFPENQRQRMITNRSFAAPKNEKTLKNEYSSKCNIVSDINEHLPTLHEYTKKCDSVVECGVRDIVSSYAFALGLKENPNNRYTLVDPYKSNKIDTFLKLCKDEGINASFIEKSDLECPLIETDLLFIDTWHVYGHLKRELAYWHSSVKKYIIMHDTTVDEFQGETIRCKFNAKEQSEKSGIPLEEILKGLWPAIEEFLKEHSEWKLEKRYTNNNGLTILKRE